MAQDVDADNVRNVGQMRQPLYFALGMCAGASVYFTLPAEPSMLSSFLVAALTASLILFVMSRWDTPAGVRILLVVTLGAVTGFSIAKAHTRLRAPPVLTQTLGPVMLEGWLTDVEPGKNGKRLRLTVHAMAGLSPQQAPQHVRLTHSNRLEVEPGRFVRCWAVLRPPPQPEFPGDYPFNRQAFFEGLDAVGYVMGRCRGGPLGAQVNATSRLETEIGAIRRSLARHVNEEAGPRAGGFAAALTSGDRSFMSQADMEALRNSGLAHLLAISGLHLGIVGALVYFAVRRTLSTWEWLALRVPAQKPAAAAALMATALYLVLSGASISTQRAFIMAAIVFLAILLDRSPLSLRTFALAMIAVLLLQPASVMTPGFQMSFAATGALIATYEAWSRRAAAIGETRRRGLLFALKSLVVTSAVGAAATAPFALYHFDRVAPLGLLANLLAMPIFSFISAPAAGLALVTWPVGLSDLCLAVFGWSLERVLAIAHWASLAGDGGLELGGPMPPSVLILLILGLIGACLGITAQQRFGLSAAALAASALVWMLSPQAVVHWSSSGDAYVVTKERGVLRVPLADGEGLAPLHYADITASSDCLNDGCDFRTAAGRILIGAPDWIDERCDESAAIILSKKSLPPDCGNGAMVVLWEEIIKDGAATILSDVTGTLDMYRPKCGRRPWTPCLKNP